MKNNLIDELFDKSKSYRMGVLCTYSLNIEFLENYLLNLDGLANCNSLCIFTDRETYNQQFDDILFRKIKWVNKRYLLTPIDTKGVFHPKMYILASDKAVRIGIGSANLTREGLASNLEIASVFEITHKDKTYLSLLIECIQFLKVLAQNSNSKSAINSIDAFNDYIHEFLDGDLNEDIHLLHNLNMSIASQAFEFLKDRMVNRIDIISPFYDENLKVLRWVKNTFTAETNIFIQQGKSNFPVSKFDNNKTNIKIFVYRNQERYIHGKAIMFSTDIGVYLLTGSANCTDSALLSSKYSANIETSLWGKIDSDIADSLRKPNGNTPVLLKNLKDLNTSPIEITKNEYSSEFILDWLDEVLFFEDQLHIALKDKKGYYPKIIIINDDLKKFYDYNEMIDISTFKKSELLYAHVEGIDSFGAAVKSGKMWIVNLDKDREPYLRKRYFISEPSQLIGILKDIILNGTEQDLIDYLLKFNIPLDLSGLNLRGSSLRALGSQGNVFGQIIDQSKNFIKYPEMIDAVRQFLATNYNKLCSHYDYLQLNKLDNFFLIYGTIFNMIEFIDSYIITFFNKKMLKAEEWSLIRNYFDLLLQYSKECLDFLWLSSEANASFAVLVDKAIQDDKQQVLGPIKSFDEFLNVREYDYRLKAYYSTTKKVCQHIEHYINKRTVLTTKGKIVKPIISSNGYRDTFILHREDIYKYARQLDLEIVLTDSKET